MRVFDLPQMCNEGRLQKDATRTNFKYTDGTKDACIEFIRSWTNRKKVCQSV